MNHLLYTKRDSQGNWTLIYPDKNPFGDKKMIFSSMGDAKDYGLSKGYQVLTWM
jgi:hypothetical protein